MQKAVFTTAIIVCGGGLCADGTPAPWVAPRCEAAARIFHERIATGEAPPLVIACSAGTSHKPMPVDSAGFVVFECTASARMLVNGLNVPPSCVVEEPASFDTIGNAFFTRLLHADVHGFSRVTVVSSRFHIARVEIIFRKVFSLMGPPGCPTPTTALSFVAVDDTGLAADVLQARVDKEERAVASFCASSAALNSIVDFWTWMHTAHLAYSSRRLCLTDKDKDAATSTNDETIDQALIGKSY